MGLENNATLQAMNAYRNLTTESALLNALANGADPESALAKALASGENVDDAMSAFIEALESGESAEDAMSALLNALANGADPETALAEALAEALESGENIDEPVSGFTPDALLSALASGESADDAMSALLNALANGADAESALALAMSPTGTQPESVLTFSVEQSSLAPALTIGDGLGGAIGGGLDGGFAGGGLGGRGFAPPPGRDFNDNESSNEIQISGWIWTVQQLDLDSGVYIG